jgi:hypothetical protein
MEEENKKRIRISNIQGVLMVGVAVVIDGVQFLLNFIPFLGWIFVSLISVFAWLTFFTWYKFNGITFTDSILRFITMVAVAIAEVLPVFNSIPAWVASVLIMLVIVRAEDTIHNKTGKDIKIIKELNRFRRNKRASII